MIPERGDHLVYMHFDSFQLFDWVHGPSMYAAQLIWADLPPEIRMLSGIAFLFFGFIGSPADDMTPFLSLALKHFTRCLSKPGRTRF